jgi:Protein of unknown function (DUF2459)
VSQGSYRVLRFPRFLHPITAIVLLLGCLLVSCEVPQRIRVGEASTISQPAASRPATIFVARRRWHVDIGFAIADVGAPLNSVVGQLPGVKYLFFGFGDRHYLMAKNRNVPAMFGALWPGPGIILVTGLRGTPAEAFDAQQVIELSVSEAQAQAAKDFIWNSLVHVAGEPITPYAQGPYEGSLYFSSVVHYSAFHTCNTWAAEALRAAGLPVRSRAVLLAGQLWRQIQKLSRAKPPDSASPAGAGAKPPRVASVNRE